MNSEKIKNNTEYWDSLRGKIKSSKGGWIPNEDAYSHGYGILNELVGNISYMQMIVLNATGRLIEKKLADWLEANFLCLSWPDARIWCNQIGALSGTVKTSVSAATVAGVLGADSIMYGGGKPSLQSVSFIQKALEKYKNGRTIEEIISQSKKLNGKPMISGFVRPISGKDERIKPLENVIRKLGIEIGEHLSLAYKLSEYLEENYGEGININGYTSAFLSDQNFTAEEVYRIRALAVASGVTACYVDTKDKPGESFLPLRCDDIQYSGKPPRKLSG